MTTEARTIEQLIAEWYATGTCSEECRLEIERVAKLVAGPYARTRRAGRDLSHREERIINGAPSHVWEMLNARIAPGHSSGRYDPSRPFQPWCAMVIRTFAVDCDREERGRKHTGRDACVGDETLTQAVDESHGEEVHAADRMRVASAMLAEFERLLPRAADRIIVAVQTGYVESVPDAVVTRWCDEADVATEVAALRSLVDTVGCLKALANVLGLTYAVVRARSSRAMKDLRDGDFRRAREEFE
jgi:hypothetical protein